MSGKETKSNFPKEEHIQGLPEGYHELLVDLKKRIRSAQVKAAIKVNRELIRLYWEIGRAIVIQQRKEGWGKFVVERLSTDIQSEFPGIRGFSPLNIWRMRAFFLAWTEEIEELSRTVTEPSTLNLSQLVTEIPWGHNIVLVHKIKDPIERFWYARKTIEFGWSRAVLVHQIETGLFHRQDKAVTNFDYSLPPVQSNLTNREIIDEPIDPITIFNDFNAPQSFQYVRYDKFSNPIKSKTR